MKKGFALGAEDYLKNPFELEELLVRIERTKKLHHIEENTLVHLAPQISYDPQNFQIITPEQTYNLRKKEAQLLEYFFSASKSSFEF